MCLLSLQTYASLKFLRNYISDYVCTEEIRNSSKSFYGTNASALVSGKSAQV